MGEIDFSQLDKANDVKVELVTLAGRRDYKVEEGTTIATLRSRYGLSGTKILNATTNRLMKDSDVITGNTQLIVTSPKKNG